MTLQDYLRPLETADPGRQPAKPMLIPPGFAGPVMFDSLEALAAELAGRLAGRTPVLARTVCTYLGFDTFPGFSVGAVARPGQNGGPPAASYVCAVAVQDTPAEVLEQLIAAETAKTRFAGRAA